MVGRQLCCACGEEQRRSVGALKLVRHCKTMVETSSKKTSFLVNRSNLGKSNSKRHYSKVGVWGTKQRRLRSPAIQRAPPPSIKEKDFGFEEEEVEYEAAATTNTTSVTSLGRTMDPSTPKSPSSSPSTSESISNKSEGESARKDTASVFSDSAPISFLLHTSILFSSSFLASSFGFPMDLEKSGVFPMEEMDACEVVDVVAAAKDKLEEESEDEDEDSIKVAVVSASEDVRTLQ